MLLQVNVQNISTGIAKKIIQYIEQNQKEIKKYKEQIKKIISEKIVYADKCGIDTYLYCEYGYISQGQKVINKISSRKYKRCGIVATQMSDKIVAPLQYSRTMKHSIFEF